MQVLDYSAGLPGARAIKEAGYAGAVRYIGLPGYTKNTNADELADFTAHGLGMALVFEHFATDWRGGYIAGAANARKARDHADAIGFPDDRPIYMAVDQDVVHENEFRAAMSYLLGAGEVLGTDKVGVYGEHDVCVRAAAEGVAAWFWQCRAWSGTPIRYFAGRHLFQLVGTVRVGGVDSDINEVLVDDWGQHNGGDTMSWDTLIAKKASPTDERTAVRAGEMLMYTNEAAWKAVDVAERNEIKLNALLGREAGDVDEAELAKQLIAQGLGSQLGRMPDDQFDALVKAMNDENDRRAKVRAGVKVPPAGEAQPL